MTDLVTIEAHVFGLACWSGPARVMPRAHRHDDIEVNVVVSGQLDYLFGGHRITIPAGATSVFWAALPHQVVATAEGSAARWLTVPLTTVLRWRLAEPLVAALLTGAPLLVLGPAADSPETEQRFARWTADLATCSLQLKEIALLEVEAYLHRVLRVARPVGDPVETEMASTVRSRSRAAVMATFVAASIAHAAGFSSSSRLYAACAEAGLPAPAAYRRIQQSAAGNRAE